MVSAWVKKNWLNPCIKVWVKLQALFADSPAKVTLGVLAAKVEQADVLPLPSQNPTLS